MIQDAATGCPKLVYFAERPPQLDHEAFIRRWRQHARLGMSMARWQRNIERYVHCDAINPVGRPPGTSICDGVAMIWYRSEEARIRHAADPAARPIMKQDERETFARPVRECAVLTEERIIKPAVDLPLKLFVRVKRGPGEDLQAFASWWRDEFSPRVCERFERLRAPAGYVQNHARRAAGADAEEPLWDCVDEIGCTDAGDCENAYRAALNEVDEQRRAVRKTETVLTVETLLYSR